MVFVVALLVLPSVTLLPMPKATSKTADKKGGSAVVKRMCSFPKGLFRFGMQEAKRVASEEGKKRPNFSGYLTKLLFQAKFDSAKPATPK